MGAVSTTTIAGVLAVRRGLAKPIGSLTQMGTVRLGKRTEGRSPLIKDFVPLASLDDVVFGGWDIFEDNCYEAAKTAGVLEPSISREDPARARSDQADAGRVRSALRQAARRTATSRRGRTSASSPTSCARTCARFKAEHGLDRLVMVWCGSTEVFLTESPAHASVAAFEKGARGQRSRRFRRA